MGSVAESPAADILALLDRYVASVRVPVAGGNNVSTLPQQVNVVPAAATLTVDLRAPEEAVLAKAESAIRHLAEDVALTYGCELTTCERMSRTAPATFDPAVVDRVARPDRGSRPARAQALVRRRARRAATRHDLPDRDGVRP
ncbi:hypothetical protein [Saccharopolyspora hattusasensis]|uniref:hypothetical protein n=1 Tax=Saccharopolyspora hattusasensis TaxID=1128679 RepID=UPI003D984200